MPNHNWSVPETSDPYTYANEFGEVIFTPVTDFMPVSDIDSNKIPEIEDVLISLDCAEQVTLITENRRGYMSVCFPFREEHQAAFAVQYSCQNRAAVCRVSIRRFETPGNVSAAEQIEKMAPKIYGPLPVD